MQPFAWGAFIADGVWYCPYYGRAGEVLAAGKGKADGTSFDSFCLFFSMFIIKEKESFIAGQHVTTNGFTRKGTKYHFLVWICWASLQVWALGLPSPCEARPRLLEGRQ